MVLEKWFCKILELFHSFGKDLANSNQKVKPGNVSLRKRALELEWACSRHLILLKQKQLRILGISVSNLLKKLDQSVKPRVRKYFILKSGKNQTNKTLKGCCFCDRGWVPVVTSSWWGQGSGLSPVPFSRWTITLQRWDYPPPGQKQEPDSSKV